MKEQLTAAKVFSAMSGTICHTSQIETWDSILYPSV